MTADALLQAGDLDGVRAELVAAVKRAPQDQGARMFLFQLFCVLGEWDKATAQLRLLAQLSPEAQMLSVAYGQAITAEAERANAFAGRVAAPSLVEGPAWLGDLSAALQAFGAGRTKEGEARREAAFDAAADTPGELDGRAFDWIADADARFGPALEAIVAGKWGLIAFESVASIKCEGVRDLRDVVWLPVQMAFKSGQSVAAFLPARYPGSEVEANPLRLGRETAWRSGPSGEVGLGQRTFSFDDGTEAGLLSLRRLTFA